MTASIWTEDRVSRLTDLWRQGWTAAQIARDLGHEVSRCAVLGKIHRLGLGRRAHLKVAASSVVRSRAGSHRPKTSLRSPRVDTRPDMPATATATVLTVGRGECRWPYGHPGETGFGLCGRTVARGAYCAAHAAVGYQRRPVSIECLVGAVAID
ncbi:MAG: GcrA family cell cycle regulator [Brevundimonas sp.]|jgi:GcrA cell cycle regulator|uniref:GcrA family cell cycle regulator n=1 Tax=Brevundimonas sp. TaxID=1871086 RepID=UPI0025B8028A|nr:GcrA family cell cycle regulator [Brevundimonas sp.]MCH4267470.1 GcrA family cell cycle regulator [Brevundimonas sp.]